MKISNGRMALVIVVVFFGGIIFANSMGLWKTEGGKIGKNSTNTTDIKGSSTFKDIGESFDIPVEDLCKAFQVPAIEAGDFKCKELETKYSNSEGKEIGTDSVRLFVAFYKGMEFDLVGDIYIPETAASVIRKHGALLESQKEYMLTHTIAN